MTPFTAVHVFRNNSVSIAPAGASLRSFKESAAITYAYILNHISNLYSKAIDNRSTNLFDDYTRY